MIMKLLKQHKLLVVGIIIVLLLVSATFLLTKFATGQWQQIPVTYGDEFIYYSHMSEVATGNILFGNPYNLEHRYDSQLALFGSSIIAAIPMFFGLSLQSTLVLDFILWGPLLLILVYWLLREMDLPKPWAVGAGLFMYIQSYDAIFRVSVRQQVYPFFFLFYIALIRFFKKPDIRNIIWLGVATGATFWIYGFLWQLSVVTLGMLVLYAGFTKQWSLFKKSLYACGIGGVLGLPPFAYSLWITTQPYFWESMNRFGLVQSHIPQAEIVYSGFGVAVVLLATYLLHQKQKISSATLWFVMVSGVGLMVTEVSNIITGQNFEIGEHIRRFIIPWLPLVTGFIAYRALKVRTQAVWFLLGILVVANCWYVYTNAERFNPNTEARALWSEEQLYVKPLAWLDAQEQEPVAVWGDSRNRFITYVTGFTKHYVLHQEFGQFNLMSNEAFQERYLVSRYFDNPNLEDLKQDMVTFAGRGKTFHEAKTLERGVKLCKIFMFWDTKKCGTSPTPYELFGEENFVKMEQKFQNQIKPNISFYLQKYHVKYIVKDTVRDPQYNPSKLGAKKMYDDGRFEIYKLP